MAWYPGAIRKVVARHTTPMARHRGVCLHVAVSEGASLFGYFNNPSTKSCSHLYVRRDGTVEQYVDTAYRAPANVEGNSSLISVETQGGVHDVDREQWTADQVASLAGICRWAHKTHGIPLDPMRDSLPGTLGVGYHRLGIDPWRKPGGELWSSSYGKVCPGAGKIAQVPHIINLAREDPAMPLTATDAALVVKTLLETDIPVPGGPLGYTKKVRECLAESSLANDALAAIGASDAQLDRVEAAIKALNLPGADQAQLLATVKQALREGTG